MTDLTNTADDGVTDGARIDEAANEKLKANNAKLLREAAEARKRAADAEAALAERQAEDQRAQEEADRKAGDFAKIEAGLNGQIEKVGKERDEWRGRYEALVGSHALTAALIEGKVDDDYKPAVAALLKERGIEITKDGAPQIEGRPLAEFVRDWLASDDGKPFITDGNAGGGAPGGKSGGGDVNNPWKAGQINLTRQGEILRSDPAKAERLKREAGAA